MSNMKASSLRLNNWIHVAGNTLETRQTSKPFLVTIDILKCIAEENEERPDAILTAFTPIRLTEDWLLKLGFVKDSLTFRKGKYILWFNGIDNREYAFMLFDQRDGIDDSPSNDFHVFSTNLTYVTHVHQLQNLYFALTGDELVMQQLATTQ